MNTLKRPTWLNGHLSIRDSTLTSCQKGSLILILHIDRSIFKKIKINSGRGQLHYNPLKQQQSLRCKLMHIIKITHDFPLTSPFCPPSPWTDFKSNTSTHIIIQKRLYLLLFISVPLQRILHVSTLRDIYFHYLIL